MRRGFDGIAVSNHGGRQLDFARSSISALPGIVAAVGGRAEIYLDGGVRRGSDIVKALSLGARAVMIGRATLYGVAAGGESGARRCLSILSGELDRCLALLGCADAHDLNETFLHSAQPYWPTQPSEQGDCSQRARSSRPGGRAETEASR